VEFSFLELGLFVFGEAGVAVGENDGFVEVAFNDAVRDAVEVGTVRGLYVAGEEGLEGDFDDLVAEQEDRGEFAFEAPQYADDLGQVVVDAAGYVEVDGEAALFDGGPLRAVVVMERHDVRGEQDEVPFRGVQGDRRGGDRGTVNLLPEPVHLALRGELPEQGFLNGQVRLDGVEEQLVEVLAETGPAISRRLGGFPQILGNLAKRLAGEAAKSAAILFGRAVMRTQQQHGTCLGAWREHLG